MKRISKQFKLGDEQTIICSHKVPEAVLADQGIFNLGGCILWLCMNCTARVRDSVLTNILGDAAKLTLRGDEDLQALLKERLNAEKALRDGKTTPIQK